MKIKRVKNKHWVHSVSCSDCGEVREVRKDSNPKRCKSCNSRRAGKIGMDTVRARMKTTPCGTCSKPIPERLGYNYCSVACRKIGKRVDRVCKCCGDSFQVLKRSIGEMSNAAGNFCSRPCYEKWMCRTERVTGRGSQWNKKRLAAVKQRPFCAMCGTDEKLQVHHIVPFRLTYDNSDDNLIPLCLKHHKIVENITHDIEATGTDLPTLKIAMGGMLREHQDRWRMYHSKVSA